MRKFVFIRAVLAALGLAGTALAGGWSTSVPFTNQVAGDVITGGGYAGYDPGATAPNPGSCRLGLYNANRSESWIAVKPGTENLVGTSKIFFEKFSTFYNFHLGSHTFKDGKYAGSSMVTGYECVSTGTHDMPPSWTNNTDPNVDFDTKGRAYQITLPFNAFWANLHPNGNVGVVYSDNLGRTWTVGRPAGPGGAVAVNFYDRRLACPTDKSILAPDRGRTNFCIDASLQAFKDSGGGAVPVGANVRISQYTWDPEQPGQKIDGLSQYACAGHSDPCPNGRGFIGDYFGLAVSAANIYSFFVSTHYPSKVRSDDGGPVLPAASSFDRASLGLRHRLLDSERGAGRTRPFFQTNFCDSPRATAFPRRCRRVRGRRTCPSRYSGRCSCRR